MTVSNKVTVYGGNTLRLNGCELAGIEAGTSLSIEIRNMEEPEIGAVEGLSCQIVKKGEGSWSVELDAKNGFDLLFEINSASQLTARLSVPEGRKKDENNASVFYTLYFYSSSSDDTYFFTNIVDFSLANAYILSYSPGAYTHVAVYLSSDGTDFGSLTPLAFWELDHPIVSQSGVEKFPHADVAVTASPVTGNPWREGMYEYSFTGLDFDRYSYMLYNPDKRSGLTVTSSPASSGNKTVAKNWIGPGMELRAKYARLEDGTYYVITTKAITVEVVEIP